MNNTGFKEYNFSWAIGYEAFNYDIELFYSQFNTDLGVFSGSHIGNLSDLYAAFSAQEPAQKASVTYA
jgi:iron complex outermembrane receptor protein